MDDGSYGWWFAPEGLVDIEVGTVEAFDGKVAPAAGLEGSARIIDALSLADPNSSVLYHVLLGGTVHVGARIITASRRECLARYNVTDMLRTFARKCAALHLPVFSTYLSTVETALLVSWLGGESMVPTGEAFKLALQIEDCATVVGDLSGIRAAEVLAAAANPRSTAIDSAVWAATWSAQVGSPEVAAIANNIRPGLFSASEILLNELIRVYFSR